MTTIDPSTGEILERTTTTLWLRPVDGPRRKRIEYHASETELARIADLPRGQLPADPNDPDLLTCGPMTGAFAEIGGGTKRLRVRRGPCGLPSCGCQLEFWSVRRRNPLPAAGMLHVEDDSLPGGCPCGGYDRDSTRYRPRR